MAAQTDPDYDWLDEERADYFAAGKRKGATKLEKKKVANKRFALDLREEQQAAQRRREEEVRTQRAQRDARVEAQRTQRATVAAQRSAPRPTPAPALSAPSFSGSGTSLSSPSRETSARVIIVIVVFAAIGTVAHDAIVGTSPTKTTVKVGNGTVNVPTHLRTLGAVLIMGTVALVVNEIDPGIGLLLGIALGLDVVANTFLGNNGLFSRLQGGLFARTIAQNPAGVSTSWAMPPSTTFITPGGHVAIGPQGVGGPQQVWDGKGWVAVPSTKTN